MPTNNSSIKCLAEVSWEVANKVGGIYTVISSKAAHFVSRYDYYLLIGPYFADQVRGEFKEVTPAPELKIALMEFEKQTGCRAHYGNWLVGGEPTTILIDYSALWPRVNQIKSELWDWYGVDSLGASHDFDEPVVWSYGVAQLLAQLVKMCSDGKLVAHFHEWLAGAGLLYVKQQKLPIATVFTTHATVLGRTLSDQGIDLYAEINHINPEQMARDKGVMAKHTLEKQTALGADICTTVSEITALEVERFLGRRPDFILPNGLDSKKFLSFEDITIAHHLERNRLRQFILYYFFPYYTFDIEQTLFYFLACRYEYHTKGVDVAIKALAALNQELIRQQSKKTIVAFFFIPAPTSGINAELLENRDLFQDIREHLEAAVPDAVDRLLYARVADSQISEQALFSADFLFEMKKRSLRFRRDGRPPLSTHDISNPNDAILRGFQEAGLTNDEQSRVKVIFYPVYLTGHDGLLNLSYDESIQACHLGIFPSVYEPWGYTPLETAAAGVVPVTTDLTGYGRFCAGLARDPRNPGIFIIERAGKTDAQLAEELAQVLEQFAGWTHKQRVENKMQARKLAAFASWENLVINYYNAQEAAVK